MDRVKTRKLRRRLAPYTQRSTPLALAIFFSDIAIYLAAVAGAVLFENVLLSLACAVVAGVQICSLFVIGHDAAHGSYTDSKTLNSAIARMAFLPALHNCSLWHIAHNQLHHRLTNFKGKNSWSPMTKGEYDALPPWRRLVERVYRSPLGLAPYYLVERWWKDKFFPTRRVVKRFHRIHWLDFALLLGYLALFLAGLIAASAFVPHATPLEAVFWGFAVPFLVWNSAMGFTVYLQHTNLRVPWFNDEAQWRRLSGQEEVTIHLEFPLWYRLVSHNIMEHPAHHVAPKVPLYRLRAAQAELHRLLGDRSISERFSPLRFLQTMARCQLYDYDQHRWLDFKGRPTTDCVLPAQAADSEPGRRTASLDAA